MPGSYHPPIIDFQDLGYSEVKNLDYERFKFASCIPQKEVVNCKTRGKEFHSRGIFCFISLAFYQKLDSQLLENFQDVWNGFYNIQFQKFSLASFHTHKFMECVLNSNGWVELNVSEGILYSAIYRLTWNFQYVISS